MTGVPAAVQPVVKQVTVVIKAGGEVGNHAAQAVVETISTLRSAGCRLILVHGGGNHISRWLKRCDIPVRFHNGRRVTDEATLEVVEMVLSGHVNKAWVGALTAAGIPALGLSGRDGKLITAEPRIEEGIDLGRVGHVTGVNTPLLQSLLDSGNVPVLSPVCQDQEGQSINVNADEVAAAVASAIQAHLLLLLTDVPGVLSDRDDRNSVLPVLDTESVRELLTSPAVTDGMRPKLDSALTAVESGVERVHLIDGTDPSALKTVADRFLTSISQSSDVSSYQDLPGTLIVRSTVTASGDPAPSAQGATTTGGGPTGAWIDRGQKVLMNNYGRLPLAMSHGKGSYVYDVDGRPYLDFVSGLAVTSFGHGNPWLAETLDRQARRLIHCSNLYWIPEQIQLAEKLCELSGMDQWFFANSGTEANEAAIKLARRLGIQRKGPAAFEIITATQSFHGRTFSSLAATGQPKYQEGFGPLPPGFKHVPFGDIDAMAAAITDRTCAILVEPIQGEGGVNIPPAGYLRQLRELCDRHGILLMLDEVQTGIGRTGSWFAFQHEGILPDVITLAKALAGGVPIGAMGARGEAARVLTPGTHASTFGGNPLAAAAALAALETMKRQRLVERSALLGEKALSLLRAAIGDLQTVRDIRGRGLMIGVELTSGAAEVAVQCRQKGLLVNVIGDTVIRLLPPLTLTDEELEAGLTILTDVIKALS